MVLNGTPHAPLFGAGHSDADQERTCPRCGARVWTGAVEREHPLYENEDGGAHAPTCAKRVTSAVLIVKPAKVKP